MKKSIINVGVFLVFAVLLFPVFAGQADAASVKGKRSLVIEAHCDARYWQYSDGNGSFAVSVAKYFVLAIGRHTIGCDVNIQIKHENGSWVNESYSFSDGTSLLPFKPIARVAIQWYNLNVTSARWDVYLWVDGVMMDSEFFILDHFPL